MVRGSTHKLYRQKGTGRARMGASRTAIRRGGGVAFAKVPRDFRQRMPKKQRRLARNSAILAKIQSDNAVIIDQLSFDVPKTADFASILNNLKIERSCLVATDKYDPMVYKSVRNIPRVEVLEVAQLNAGDILRRQKLLFTRAALETLINPPAVPAESVEQIESDEQTEPKGRTKEEEQSEPVEKPPKVKRTGRSKTQDSPVESDA